MKPSKKIDSKTFQMVLRKVPRETLTACIKKINDTQLKQKTILEKNPNAQNLIKWPVFVEQNRPAELNGLGNIWLGFVTLYNEIFREDVKKSLREDEEYLKMKEAFNSYIKLEVTNNNVATKSMTEKVIENTKQFGSNLKKTFSVVQLGLNFE